MLNHATLTGRMTNDPEVQYTKDGTPVLSFRLAVNRSFKNKNGERDADFINCVIWHKAAENLANFTHKGSLIGIDGRIQTRTYQNNQGQTVYVTEIVVKEFALLEPKPKNQQGNNNHPRNGGNGNQQQPNYHNNNQYHQGGNGGYNNQPQNNYQQPNNQGYQNQNNGYYNGY